MTRYSLKPNPVPSRSGSSGASRGLRLTRVNRFTVRLLPPTFRRPMSKNPRGPNSRRSSASPFGPVARRRCATSTPPPYPTLVRGASSTVTTTSWRFVPPCASSSNPDAPEQSELRELAMALELRVEPERSAFLQHQLAADDVRIGPLVADDEDVIDEGLRPLLDRERQRHARRLFGRARLHLDDHFGKTKVQILRNDRLAIRHRLRRVERISRLRLDDAAQLPLADRRVAGNVNVADNDQRSFVDDDYRLDQAFTRPGRGDLVRRGLHRHQRVTAPPVVVLDLGGRLRQLGVAEDLAGLEPVISGRSAVSGIA